MNIKKEVYPKDPILLVDDEEAFLQSAGLVLRSKGINNIDYVSDSRKVLHLLSQKKYSVIVLDNTMPYISGKELLEIISASYPEVVIIMLTGINDVATAVECIKHGAFDYIVKPIGEDRLITCIFHALEQRNLQEETNTLKQYLLSDTLRYEEAFSGIITKNEKMLNIFKYAEAIATTKLPVLITGETGVGKELMAKAIHQISGKKGNFIVVNIAGVDDNVFSDTLFGHIKGAFTGADYERKGFIEEADGGTLFLDEIGDLKNESQVKLLRLLQEGTYYPIGSDSQKISNARIIVATNKNLLSLMDGEFFRKDLYYRLEAHEINIPPLRERMNDIELLIPHFIKEASLETNKEIPSIPKEIFSLLSNYDYPGNIRELGGLIFDSVTRHTKGILSLETIREKLKTGRKYSSNKILTENIKILNQNENSINFPNPLPTMDEFEKLLINETLKRTNGNKTLAAEILGLTRQTLINHLKDN